MKTPASFNFYEKIFTILINYALIFTLFAPSALARESNVGSAATVKSGKSPVIVTDKSASCTGWRGKITYLEKINADRYKSNGEYGWEKHQFNSVKSGEAVFSGGQKGQATMTLESRELIEEESRQKNCCWANLNGCQKETTTVRWHQGITEHIAKGDDVSGLDISIQGGRYSFNYMFPAMRGKMIFKAASSVKGYCDPAHDENKKFENTDPDKTHRYTEIKGEGRIDPKNPNFLRGSHQPNESTMIVWELTKVVSPEACDEPLSVNNIKLEQHVFPNRIDWSEVSETVVDGNEIRIKATVANGSDKAKSGKVIFKETTSGEILGERSVTVPAESEKEVDINWDTNGYAWTDGEKPAPERKIEARLVGGDYVETGVKIIPKPVVLVHGLWSNAEAWSKYQGFMTLIYGSDEWKAFPVGADPQHGIMNTGEKGTTKQSNSIFQNAQELGKQIKFTQESMNAWHVDIVAHSMGGLISRFYIHSFMPTNSPGGKPYISKLVMLGTPNMGSPCANLMDGTFDFFNMPVEAMRQLRPSVVAEFNAQVTNRKGVKFSILVGMPAQATCQEETPGDGVVSIPSAIWEVKDRAFTFNHHLNLTEQIDFATFVRPRLVIGPKKAKQQQAAIFNEKAGGDFLASNNPFIGENLAASTNPKSFLANFAPLATTAQSRTKTVQVSLKKGLKIAAGASAELPLGNLSAAAKRAGITFVTAPDVTVSLVDSNGDVKQTIEAGSAEAAQDFKTFYLKGESGNLKLRFENTGDAESVALVSGWTDTNPFRLEIIQLLTGGDMKRASLQAQYTNNGAPVVGAAATARFIPAAGNPVSIQLYDDGKHDDAKAGDGIYGGQTEALPDGEYVIEIRANNTATTGAISIGAK